MSVHSDDGARWDALETRERRLLGAALVLLLTSAAAVVLMARASGDPRSRGPTAALAALVVAFAADAAWRGKRLADARRALAVGKAERRDLLRRVGELSEFTAALDALDRAADAEELWERLPAEAIRLGAADAAEVVLRGEDGAARVVAAWPDAGLRAIDATEAAAWREWFDAGGPPWLAPNAAALSGAIGGGTGRASVVAAPLGPRGRPLGALVAARTEAAAPGFDLGSLQVLGLVADAATRIAALRASERRARHEHRRLELSLKRLSRAQAELVRSERARAAGALVTGVAHELNNPLTAISGYAQLLERRLADLPGPAGSWARELRAETDRCASILRNLLSVARREADDGPRRAPLAAIVHDALALKSYDLRAAGVRVTFDLPADLPTPDVDRATVQNVLLRLVDNALEALAGTADRRLEISARAGDDRAEVRVFNNGPAVPAARRDRIFEPFFTTKPAGEGVGLGLAVCRDLLTASGASIALADDDGSGGATFVLGLPIVAAYATSGAA